MLVSNQYLMIQSNTQMSLNFLDFNLSQIPYFCQQKQQPVDAEIKSQSPQSLSFNKASRVCMYLNSRIKGMVSRIQRYKPTFHYNQNYQTITKNEIQRRIQQRQKEGDKLFQENLKLIYRLETTGPRIQTKKFPEVKPNPRRLKVLSQNNSKSLSKTKFKIKDVFRNEQQLYEQNIKMITNIECTGPKISCWTSKKVRTLNQLVREKKHIEERKILEKFKEISQQLNKISRMRSFKRSSSNLSINNKSTIRDQSTYIS